MQFMCDNAPEIAEEIRAIYIESMGRTIVALFRAYHAQLMKLELEMANRHDLIAVEVSWAILQADVANLQAKTACTCDRDFDPSSSLEQYSWYMRVLLKRIVLNVARLQCTIKYQGPRHVLSS